VNFCEGCNDIAKTGRFCDKCAAQPQNAKVSKAHPCDEWYYKAAWRGKYGVRRWYVKNHPCCEFVEADGTRCTRKTEDVHHTKPWKDSRDWHVFLGGVQGEFLMALCKQHHSAITMHDFQFGPDKKEER
jgi:hypothetical protein